MLNVLIVDDEPFIRQGLRVMIDWAAEGFEIVGEASDGAQALDIMEYSRVDLVIADIQMPGMNGLALMREIRAEGMNDVQFVILSGYQEFSYAQEAMKYGCLEYIIKPVNKEDLIRILRFVQQQHKQKCIDEEEEEVRDSAVLERNLLPLLMGKYDEINLAYVREHLSLNDKLRYVNVELDMTDPRLKEKNEESRRGMQRALYAGMKSALGKRGNHIVLNAAKLENSYDVGIIFCNDMASELGMKEEEYFNFLMERLRQSVECRLVMQVGSRVDSLEELSESYRSANIAKFMQDFRGSGELYVADDGAQTQNDMSAEAYGKVKNYLDDVVSAVELGNRPDIESAVNALYRCMGDLCMDYRVISMNLSHILFRLMHIAIERDSNLDQQEAVNYLIENAFDKGVVRGSATHFSEFCCEYADYIKQIDSQSAGNVLSMVEREIAEKYMTNISLKQLGETLYINSAYLGQLFKKHYGMSFKDYLNMVRINASVDLLARTDMKVYEISAAVGYSSVDYFINKFVLQRGHTPAKFRKNIRARNNETGFVPDDDDE